MDVKEAAQAAKAYIIDLGAAAEGLRDKKSLFNTEGGWRVLQAVVRRFRCGSCFSTMKAL